MKALVVFIFFRLPAHLTLVMLMLLMIDDFCWHATPAELRSGICWPLLSCYFCWLADLVSHCPAAVGNAGPCCHPTAADRLSRYTTASKILCLSACWVSKLAYNGNSWDGCCFRQASTSQTVMQSAAYGSHGYRYYRNMHMNTDKHHDKN